MDLLTMANFKFPLLTFALILSAGGTLAFDPPTIPLNWTTVYPCAVDVPARVLTGVVTTLLPNNSPAACIELCDSRDFTYAGVEYSNECHCGTGLAGTPESAPVSECDLPCSGDEDLACGGSWRVQVRTHSHSRLEPRVPTSQACQRAGESGLQARVRPRSAV